MQENKETPDKTVITVKKQTVEVIRTIKSCLQLVNKNYTSIDKIICMLLPIGLRVIDKDAWDIYDAIIKKQKNKTDVTAEPTEKESEKEEESKQPEEKESIETE